MGLNEKKNDGKSRLDEKYGRSGNLDLYKFKKLTLPGKDYGDADRSGSREEEYEEFLQYNKPESDISTIGSDEINSDNKKIEKLWKESKWNHYRVATSPLRHYRRGRNAFFPTDNRMMGHDEPDKVEVGINPIQQILDDIRGGR